MTQSELGTVCKLGAGSVWACIESSDSDLINPSELGILEREIERALHGRAVVIPRSEKTRGHGNHTIAALWKDELVKLLTKSDK